MIFKLELISRIASTRPNSRRVAEKMRGEG